MGSGGRLPGFKAARLPDAGGGTYLPCTHLQNEDNSSSHLTGLLLELGVKIWNAALAG